MLRRNTPNGVAARATLRPGVGRLIVRHPLLVIAAWVALATALFLTIPPLMEVAQKNPPGFLPSDSSVMTAGKQMQDAFDEGGAGNLAIVMLTNDNGLTPDDEATYHRLVDRLKADTANVLSTQDFFSTPELRQVMTSQGQQSLAATGQPAGDDGHRRRSAGLPARRHGRQGRHSKYITTRQRDRPCRNVRRPQPDRRAGPARHRGRHHADGADDSDHGVPQRRRDDLPLATIGVSLVVAQQVVAGPRRRGVLGLGPQTFMLMTGMMMGAGTDYAVFLFSRYHECVRTGMSPTTPWSPRSDRSAR